MRFNTRFRSLLVIAAILLLGYGLRIATLGDYNFNWDEGWSNWIVSLPYEEMIWRTAADVHPPLYYQLLRATTLIGDGEFIVRWPSVMLGVIAIALTYQLGATIGGFRVGIIAALLLAISRAHIDIAQLARMHMIAAVFCTLGLWMTILVWRNPKRMWPAVFYVIATTGALYSFYLAVMMPLATNLAFVFVWFRKNRSPRLLITWIVLQIAVVLLFAPWALYALGLMHGWTAGDPLGLRAFLEFYAVTLTTGIPAFWHDLLPLITLSISVIAVGTVYLMYAIRKSSDAVNNFILLACAVLMPAIIVFLLILPLHNLGRPLAGRYLPLMIAGFYVIVAWAVVEVSKRQRWAGYGGLAVVIGVALTGLPTLYQNRIIHDDFISVGEMLYEQRQEGDGLIMHNDRLWPHLYANYTGERIDIPYRQIVDRNYVRERLRSLWESSDAVWLLQTHESIINDPTREVERWLERRAESIESWTFNRSKLTLYVKEPGRNQTISNIIPGQYTPPEAPLSPEIGLYDARIPVQTYSVGDELVIALYWDEPPVERFSIELKLDTYGQVFSFEPPQPATEGITRQTINIPLSGNFEPGQYDVILDSKGGPDVDDEGKVSITEFTLVSFAPDAAAEISEVQYPLNWDLNGEMALLGYSIAEKTFSAGDELQVNLYWQISEPLQTRYKMIVYLLGDFNPASGNPLWGEQDTEPVNWQLPTTQWPTDTVLRDPYSFTIFEQTPAGEYGLGIAVYDMVTGERLIIRDESGAELGNMAIMTPITIR